MLEGVREACLGLGCLWRQGILDYVHGGQIILDYSLGCGNGQPRTISLAYIKASRASSLCPTAAPSANLVPLTRSLVSYARGRGSSPSTPSISTPHMSSWVIDSGASSHMAGFPSVLTSYRPETSIPDVCIAHGHSCPVLGSGQSRATSSLPLQNVLHIPGFPANLLSIS